MNFGLHIFVSFCRERRKRKEELRAEKKKYKEGFWNVQCVSLGGLGRDPCVDG